MSTQASAPALYTHDTTLFRVGDTVTIHSKVEKAHGWTDIWEPTLMDKYVGQVGTVVVSARSADSGYKVQFADKTVFYFPSPALVTGSTTTSVTPVKAKRRRRIGAGPWDAAPCTHLRWNLMGFFRERLALAKATVEVTLKDGTKESVEIAAMDVVCTKCNLKMTLQAK
jgi:hypothetical protein